MSDQFLLYLFGYEGTILQDLGLIFSLLLLEGVLSPTSTSINPQEYSMQMFILISGMIISALPFSHLAIVYL